MIYWKPTKVKKNHTTKVDINCTNKNLYKKINKIQTSIFIEKMGKIVKKRKNNKKRYKNAINNDCKNISNVI